MSEPGHLPEDVRAVWLELHDSGLGDGPGFEAFCGQVARLRDAQERISREGVVVADSKGNPVPHPALAIETKAQAEVRAWLKALGAGASVGGAEGVPEDEFARARAARAARAAGA